MRMMKWVRMEGGSGGSQADAGSHAESIGGVSVDGLRKRRRRLGDRRDEGGGGVRGCARGGSREMHGGWVCGRGGLRLRRRCRSKPRVGRRPRGLVAGRGRGRHAGRAVWGTRRRRGRARGHRLCARRWVLCRWSRRWGHIPCRWSVGSRGARRGGRDAGGSSGRGRHAGRVGAAPRVCGRASPEGRLRAGGSGQVSGASGVRNSGGVGRSAGRRGGRVATGAWASG